jgi:hypothetical protein
LETSDNLHGWRVAGWWSSEGSDQSLASFQFSPAGPGLTALRVTWPRGADMQKYARLVVRLR